MAKRLADDHLILTTIASVLITSSISQTLPSSAESLQHVLKSKLEIIDLGGNTPGVWPAWHLSSGQVLDVKIVSLGKTPQDKIDTIKDAILSENSIGSNMSTTGNSKSVFYMGWKGALDEASKSHTVLHIPDKFRVVDDGQNNDVTIILTDKLDKDGYSGYTKLSERDDVIRGASITIYKTDNRSIEELDTITRHEMGHALGLAHSNDPDDLMYYVLTNVPSFISPCDVEHIVSVYDVERSANFAC